MPGHSHSHHHGASPLQEKSSGCCGGSESAGTIDSEPTLTTRSSEHHHSHTHHHHHAEEEESNSVLCLAVVRENGTDVVIFDASGVPMTFRYQTNEASNTAADATSDDKDSQVLQQQKLCFSTHGATAVDDWMTPCFDEHGNHGTPAESCFCGVDTPHVHAHLRNMCLAAHQQQQERDTATTTTTSSSSKDSYGLEKLLASQTLYLLPTGTTDTTEDDAAACNLLVLPVSDSLPKACNSQEIEKRFNAAKCRKIHQHDSTCSSATAAYKAYKNSKARRILHKVRHDDHEDYLVHNADTGELHLEHACTDCGSDDVHGRFQNVGQRKWRNKKRGSSSFKHVQLHFFEVSPTPFSILDHLPNLFDTKTSGRVATVENTLKTATAATTTPVKAAKPAHVPVPTIEPLVATATLPLARSILSCDKICCSSEVPMIRRVLEPMPGIDKVMVNVPLKQVIVMHDSRATSANDMLDALNRVHFGATILTNGDAALAANMPSSGRSQVYVQYICCASEIPAVNKVVQPMEGVTNVSINATTKMVFVDHVFGVVSAQHITDALNAAGYGALLKFDAGSVVRQQHSSFVRSTLTFDSLDESTDTGAFTQFLQTYDTTQVETFVVDIPSKSISVFHNPFSLSAQDIASALKKETGLEAKVSMDGADLSTWNLPTFDEEATDPALVDHTSVYPKPAVIVCGVLWIVSMLSYIGGNWEYLKYVGCVSIVFGLPPIALKAFRTLRRFHFDTNCLMFFASVGAVGLQDYTEAAAVVFLFALSEWLEVRATSRARHALSAIVQLRPDKAHIVHPSTKELVVVPASVVPVGAIVSVKSGEKVPCDGIIFEGRSTLDESSLTGESRPVVKGVDEEVSGGTVNCGLAQLMIRTTCTADNSAVSRLIRLVEEAQANRSETEKLVDEFAKIYTPIVVLAAIFMVSIPWAFGPETGRFWTNNGLILMVVACPCALIISTPVTYVAGLAATAQKGVLIKGGAYLEALGLIKSICFDKTGTLTTGEFALLHLDVIGVQYTRKDILQHLALMEDRASHPLAQSILKAAKNENINISRDLVVEKHTAIAGEGLFGVVNGLEVHVGNERMFRRLGLLDSLSNTDRQKLQSWALLGGTIGYMSIEGAGIVCIFCAADAVRKEAPDVVSAFQKAGMRVVMLTGDNQDAALAIGSQIGLSGANIKSKLLPEEKLELVKEMSGGEQTNRSIIGNPCSARRLTMMCGDGVNDAPALAAADVGVAMGAGAALAMETADVTLLDSDLRKLAYCIQMGRRVINKIKQNIVFSIAVKVIVLVFALIGKTSLWAAIASDVGAMILVTLNSMLLLPGNSRTTDSADERTRDPESGIDGYQSRSAGISAPAAAVPSSEAKNGAGETSCCGSRTKHLETGSLASSSHAHTHGHGYGHDHSHDSDATSCGVKAKQIGVSKTPCCSSGTCDKTPAPVSLDTSHSHGHAHAHQAETPDMKMAFINSTCEKKCCGSESKPADVTQPLALTDSSKSAPTAGTCRHSHAHDHGEVAVKAPVFNDLATSTIRPAKSCCNGGACEKDALAVKGQSHSHEIGGASDSIGSKAVQSSNSCCSGKLCNKDAPLVDGSISHEHGHNDDAPKAVKVVNPIKSCCVGEALGENDVLAIDHGDAHAHGHVHSPGTFEGSAATATEHESARSCCGKGSCAKDASRNA